jgi:hypothetical protein
MHPLISFVSPWFPFAYSVHPLTLGFEIGRAARLYTNLTARPPSAFHHSKTLFSNPPVHLPEETETLSPPAMRTAAVVGAILLAPAAFAAPQTSATGGEYLNYSVLDTTPASSSVLQADVLASAAAINQQIYQSSTNPTQWKKCNRNNAVYRREWFVPRIDLMHGSLYELPMIGPPSLHPRRRTTSGQCNACLSCLRRRLKRSVQVARIAMM